MASDDRFELAITGWLKEAAPARLPERVLEATFEQTRRTRQGVGRRTRLRAMPRRATALGAAAALVAVVLAIQAIVVMSPPPTPRVDLGIFAPVSGRIVYGSEPGFLGIEDGLWAVDPDATNAPLVRLAAEAATPLGWSRDGTRLLIQKDEQNLFILHADGTETQVTDQLRGNDGLNGSSRPSGATISPDGSRVVFADQTVGASPSCHDGALFGVDADGGPAEILFESRVHDGIVRAPTFSPDGTRVAFVDGYCDSQHSVWIMDADGGDPHVIVSDATEPLGATHVHGLAWSPAGDRIAIAVDQGIYMFAPDGSGFEQILPAAARTAPSQLSWSPDGMRIAYTVGCDEDPLDAQALGCTFAIAGADGSGPVIIGDGMAGPWHPGSLLPDPGPDASPDPSTDPTWGGMWPQTSLDEVRAAQARYDAGDPDLVWQVGGVLEWEIAQHHPKDAPIFLRFLEERLGWQNYRWDEAFAHPDGLVDGDVVYVRCGDGDATDRYRASDPRLRECAPTLDGGRFETVRINVAQLDRKGPKGIWVVTSWQMIEPAKQAATPTQADLDASIGAFLQARIAGHGAEALVDVAEYASNAEEWADLMVPLLYATSTGAPYERSEFDVVYGPTWPTRSMLVEARLYADGGETVVEQRFGLEPDATGRLRVLYRFEPGTENGRAIRVRYGFLDGVVTYLAGSPLAPSQDEFRDDHRLAIDGILGDGILRRVAVVLADPRPIGQDCREGPAPADAATLAATIAADPDFETSGPVAVTVGGLPALQMDVVATGPNTCFVLLGDAPFTVGADRARVVMVDLPEGSRASVLAVATITDADSFATVTAYATRIVESIEIHAP